MRYLVIAPQLGYQLTGELVRGGLLQFGRCVVRAMASFEAIETLGIWCQVDPPGVEAMIAQTVRTYAHVNIHLDIRAFGGSRIRLALELVKANWHGTYDRVMYLLVNQAELALLPGHPPYSVWEIGRELFETTSWTKRLALRNASSLLSISRHTANRAAEQNNLPPARVVHLCSEPPLYESDRITDDLDAVDYDPSSRECVVLIVANIYKGLLYKGHLQLIAGWNEVVDVCPQAVLWIVGDGDGRPLLEQQVQSLPTAVAKQIVFWGRVDDTALDQLYRRCRVFAMPSTGEGFGLVFADAARYGLPCIAGRHDAAKEIIIHGETGLLVEQQPHDVAIACISLLTDDAMALRMSEAGCQRYWSTYRFGHFQRRLLQALEADLTLEEL